MTTHEELKEDIKIAYETRTPLFIWGAVGIGKSESVRQTAEEIALSLGLEISENANEKDTFGFLDLRISQLEPSDLRGLPAPNIEEGTTKWLTPNWLPKDKDSKGILFFDELNLSPPSIQAVAYQLILDRRIGDYILPDGWIILSAGNRMEDRCNVFDMSSALSNRFTHTELDVPSTKDWTNWSIKNEVDGRIISFVNFKPNSLHRSDSKLKDKAFPTPRSWVFCSRLIKGREAKNVERLIASAVGDGTSKELMGFLRLQTKIDLKKILEDPKQVSKIDKVDLKYVLVGALAEKYKSNPKDFEKIIAICDYLEAEFAILLLRMLKGANETNFRNAIIKSSKGTELLTKYAEIVN